MTDFVDLERYELDTCRLRDQVEAIADRQQDLERLLAEVVRREDSTRAAVLFVRHAVRAVMSDAQWDAFVTEQRAGVTNDDAGDVIVERSETERRLPFVNAQELAAFKSIGALFKVDPDLDGPCFNRDAAPIERRGPRVWKVNDVCWLCVCEWPDRATPAGFEAFDVELEARDYMASLLKVYRPENCDGPLIRVTWAQVTAIDTLANRVLSFNESAIVI